MKSILSVIFFLPFMANAQNNIFIAIEPMYTLGNRDWNKVTTDNYLTARNVLGIGVRAGYEVDLNNNFFVDANIHFTNLNNGVTLNYDNTEVKSDRFYGENTYMFTYYRGLGVTLSGGYRIKLNERHSFDIGAGLHGEVGMGSSGSSIQLADTLTPTLVYSEGTDDKAKFVWGIDGFLLLNFYIKNQRFFTGFHYSVSPGSKINGTFESMQGYPSNNNGSYKLSVSYVALSLGIRLSK